MLVLNYHVPRRVCDVLVLEVQHQLPIEPLLSHPRREALHSLVLAVLVGSFEVAEPVGLEKSAFLGLKHGESLLTES